MSVGINSLNALEVIRGTGELDMCPTQDVSERHESSELNKEWIQIQLFISEAHEKQSAAQTS